MKLWLVYESHQYPEGVVFHGLYRRLRDAKATYDTEHENLRASGNNTDQLAIQRFTFEPHSDWGEDE